MTPLPEISRRQQALSSHSYSFIRHAADDAGIGILDKLRTTGAVPSPQHIHQLLYLALYPSDAPTIVPKKQPIVPTKRRGTGKSRGEVPPVVPPTQEAIDHALDVLHHFLSTNGPKDLLDCIPSYENDKLREEGDENTNSLAYHATVITKAKHCWELLLPGYVLSDGDIPLGKGKEKVASYAWGVLGWLLEGFEKEAATNGGASTLLANQLPKSSTGLKTTMDASLDVVFYAFSEPMDAHKMELGRRLLTLLIGLTKATPPKLSPDRLVFETCRRLEGLSLASYSAFLARIAQRDFRMSLACSFITKHSDEPAPPPAHPSPVKKPVRSTSRTSRGTTPVPTVPSKPTLVHAHSTYHPERALAILRLNVKLQENWEEDEEEDGEVQSVEEQRLRFDMMKVQLLGAINDQLKDQSWRDAVARWLKSGGAELNMSGEEGEFMEKMAAVGWAAAGFVAGWQKTL